MRWIDRAILWMAAAGSFPCQLARAEDDPPPTRSIEQVLAEWQKRTEGTTSLSASFTSVVRSPAWGDEKGRGRIVLGSRNQACVELHAIGEAPGQAPALKERLVFTGKEAVQYDVSNHAIYRFRFPEERAGPPELGCLPFFFGMKAEEARGRFDWRVLRDDEKGLILRVGPKRKNGLRGDFDHAFLELDRRTFDPVWFRVYDGENSVDFTEYRTVGIRRDEPVDILAMASVVPQGWTTSRAGRIDPDARRPGNLLGLMRLISPSPIKIEPPR